LENISDIVYFMSATTSPIRGKSEVEMPGKHWARKMRAYTQIRGLDAKCPGQSREADQGSLHASIMHRLPSPAFKLE
jgi:hypothetical protein